MLNCRYIQTVFALVSLLRPTAMARDPCKNDDKSDAWEKPSNLATSKYKPDSLYDPDYLYKNEYYPNPHIYNFMKRDIPEYGEYKEEKEVPNLNKGLGFFSWWKSDSNGKKSKNGTHQNNNENVTHMAVGGSLNSNICTNASLNCVQDLASSTACNTDTDLYDPCTTNKTYQTLCFTITQACATITVGNKCSTPTIKTTKTTTPICTTRTTHRASTKHCRATKISPTNTLVDSGADVGGDEINISIGGEETSTRSTFEGGMLLPIIQLPLSNPVACVQNSTKKVKMPNSANNFKEDSISADADIMVKPRFNGKLPLQNSTNIVNDEMPMEEPPFLLSFPNKNITRDGLLEITNPIYNSIVPAGAVSTPAVEINIPNLALNIDANKKQPNYIAQNKFGFHFKNEFSPIKINLENNSKLIPDVFNVENVLESSVPNTEHHDLLEYFSDHDSDINFINQQLNGSNSDAIAINYSLNKANQVVESTNSKLFENEAIPNMEQINFNGECLKYNETYLSQVSNTTTNLVALCKNITCKGNDYLAQCCSRPCQPGKCKGEDFSYLHPIPGDTTTISSTMKTPVNQGCFNRTSERNDTSNFNYATYPKKLYRFVRDNGINDFVRFQLMHGMTAPDRKEMMNALKQVTLQKEKVNRELHQQDQDFVPLNGKGQIIQQMPILENHRLSKKEPSSFLSPIYSDKVLDDLRATISNSLFQANLNCNSLPKDKYRTIRNHGINDQLENIKENNMILERLRKETEMELKRLSLLEMRRREEESFFIKEREKELNELKTIQELIHREFESRPQPEAVKEEFLSKLKDSRNVQADSPIKDSTYSNLIHEIENSMKNNDISLIIDKYSAHKGNSSINPKLKQTLVDTETFPELEIKNSATNPHDDTLVVLNLDTNKDMLAAKAKRKKRTINLEENKIFNENL